MSPEERACDLLNRYSLVWGLETASDRGLQSMIEAIATAIKEAEDAAREQVVSEIEDELEELPSYGHEEAGLVYKYSDLVSLLASHASPLKSQEP